jgi:putative effector of murein hydrolase LrgA (UPF0299 family)
MGLSENRVLLYFALVEFTVACCAFAFVFYLNQPAVHIDPAMDEMIQYLVLLVCPPSLGLLAADNAREWGLFVAMHVIATENAFVYVVVGAVARVLWRRRDPAR